MCLAIQQMIDEGHAEGREEGREEERASNVRAMISLMRSLNLSDSDIFERLKTSFALTDEQTARYIEMAEVRE